MSHPPRHSVPHNGGSRNHGSPPYPKGGHDMDTAGRHNGMPENAGTAHLETGNGKFVASNASEASLAACPGTCVPGTAGHPDPIPAPRRKTGGGR